MGKKAQRRKAEKIEKKQAAKAPPFQKSGIAMSMEELSQEMRQSVIDKAIEPAKNHPALQQALNAEGLFAYWGSLPVVFSDGSPTITVDLARVPHAGLWEFAWTFRMHFAFPRSIDDIDSMVGKLLPRIAAIGDAMLFLEGMFMQTDSSKNAMLNDILLPQNGHIQDPSGGMIFFRQFGDLQNRDTLPYVHGEHDFLGHIEDVVLDWRHILRNVWSGLYGVDYFSIGRAMQSAVLTETLDQYGARYFDTELILNNQSVPAKARMNGETLEVSVYDTRFLTAIGDNFKNASDIVKTPKPISSTFRMTHQTMGVTEEMYATALSLGQLPKPDTSNVVDLGPVDFSAGVTA